MTIQLDEIEAALVLSVLRADHARTSRAAADGKLGEPAARFRLGVIEGALSKMHAPAGR